MTSDTITIQQCKLEDWEKLLEVSFQSFEDAFKTLTDPSDYEIYVRTAFQPEQIKSELSDTHSLFFFCIEKVTKQVLGYLKLRWDRSEVYFGSIPALEVQRIYFLKQYWNKGYGKILLQFAEDWAKKNNYTFIWLCVWHQNHSAMRFYEREGWESFERKNFQFGTTIHNDFVFRKQL